jgi:hypothetical protein
VVGIVSCVEIGKNLQSGSRRDEVCPAGVAVADMQSIGAYESFLSFGQAKGTTSRTKIRIVPRGKSAVKWREWRGHGIQEVFRESGTVKS